MPPSKSLLLPLFLAAALGAACCQDEISDPGAKKVCASVQHADVPAADRPTAADEKALAKCSSLDAYFGFNGQADPVKARKCAIAEIDRGDKAVLGGKAILMMVYANGKGVPRNYDLALKLACTAGGAPGDAAGRVMELDRMRTVNFPNSIFSICDHSSGRELYEQCVILTERFDKPERDQKFNDLTAHWNAAEKKAFHTFMDEAETFFAVQAANGINLEGSFEVQEKIFYRNSLLESLQKFEQGELPQSSPDEFKRAEADEAAAYQRTQKGDIQRWGTITSETIRKSEDEWRRYCDAWIVFAKRRYPRVSGQSWKTWLDEERVVSFNRFLR